MAAGWETAIDLLSRSGYSHVSYFVDRRHDIPLAAARASLKTPQYAESTAGK